MAADDVAFVEGFEAGGFGGVVEFVVEAVGLEVLEVDQEVGGGAGVDLEGLEAGDGGGQELRVGAAGEESEQGGLGDQGLEGVAGRLGAEAFALSVDTLGFGAAREQLRCGGGAEGVEEVGEVVGARVSLLAALDSGADGGGQAGLGLGAPHYQYPSTRGCQASRRRAQIGASSE